MTVQSLALPDKLRLPEPVLSPFDLLSIDFFPLAPPRGELTSVDSRGEPTERVTPVKAATLVDALLARLTAAEATAPL